MEELFTWRLDQLDQSGFDWGPFDADGDGVLDHVVVLHSGYTAETGEIPCHENHLERIWSQVRARTYGCRVVELLFCGGRHVLIPRCLLFLSANRLRREMATWESGKRKTVPRSTGSAASQSLLVLELKVACFCA